MKLPTLYKKSKTGAIQAWSIEVRGATVVVRHGIHGGAMQETSDTFKAGKNAGRSNATTPEQQAVLNAEAKHLKQRKKGYVTSLADAEAGTLDALIEGGIKPMLARTYDKAADKIKFPGFVQPKLDGHRCVAHKPDGTATLWTRSRKRITSVPHIELAVGALHKGATATVEWLDGELYNHEFHDKFQQLTSILRKQGPQPGHEVAQYHVYDLPTHGGTFRERLDVLRLLAKSLPAASPIVVVDTVLVEDEKAMWAAHERFKAAGYEGTIFRNADGRYELDTRSSNLVKLKDYQDEEFKVVGIEEGRGKLTGHVGAYVCALPDGRTFNAKMIGPLADLRAAFAAGEKAAVGRWLTVRFMKYTEDGVPFHPRAIRWREDL